jgi:hypothetical protein
MPRFKEFEYGKVPPPRKKKDNSENSKEENQEYIKLISDKIENNQIGRLKDGQRLPREEFNRCMKRAVKTIAFLNGEVPAFK